VSTLVEVRGLRVRRGGLPVLEVASLDVRTGEVLALVGPNGAGKTTLLLALARLLGPQEGEIVFRGRSLAQWNTVEYRRRMALVFQVPLLLDMSVADNVSMGLRFRRVANAEIRGRVDTWLNRFGVEKLARRRAGELSGGEAQRVSLARAFVLEPELLLLDEPFPSLDPPARQRLLDDLGRLLKQAHCTTILVTHNLKEAASLGDRVAVLVAGRLRQVAPAARVKARPADEDVAAFIHTMPR
jgi:ABC-type sulfate/molybdate transport systems ATPase subunit